MAEDRTRRHLLWLGFAGLLIYIGWIGGPYLRSVIVRDAALTTWINVTAAPIGGTVGDDPHYPGERVGADGRLVGIDDPRADGTALAKARAERRPRPLRRRSSRISMRRSPAPIAASP
jgi:hypothetical protein